MIMKEFTKYSRVQKKKKKNDILQMKMMFQRFAQSFYSSVTKYKFDEIKSSLLNQFCQFIKILDDQSISNISEIKEK